MFCCVFLLNTHNRTVLLQVALGLITSKASHIVWPPRRWQRIKSAAVPDRLLILEPSTVIHSEQSLSAVELEETLLNNANNCDNPKCSR